MSFTKQAFWLWNFQPSCQECAFMKAHGQLAHVHLEQSFEAYGVYHCLNFPRDELFWNFHNKSPVCDYFLFEINLCIFSLHSKKK